MQTLCELPRYQVIEFTVPGVPVAKGRPKFSTRGGYAQAYTPSKTTKAEQHVAITFLDGNCAFAQLVDDDTKTILPRRVLASYKAQLGREDSESTRTKVLSGGTSVGRDTERAAAFRDAGRTYGIAVTLRFWCTIPSGLSKRKREALDGQLCLKKPDIDNYVKLVLDALNGIAWEDDNAVASIAASKGYSFEPRTEVCITYLQKTLDK